MSEMIRRIAERLYNPAGDPSFTRFDETHENVRGAWLAQARAAIEEMREPTGAMVAAADDCFDRSAPSAAYGAMIDAALQD